MTCKVSAFNTDAIKSITFESVLACAFTPANGVGAISEGSTPPVVYETFIDVDAWGIHPARVPLATITGKLSDDGLTHRVATDAAGTTIDTSTFINVGAGRVDTSGISSLTGAGILAGIDLALVLFTRTRRAAINPDALVDVDAGCVDATALIAFAADTGKLPLDLFTLSILAGTTRTTVSHGTLIDIDTVQSVLIAPIALSTMGRRE